MFCGKATTHLRCKLAYRLSEVAFAPPIVMSQWRREVVVDISIAEMAERIDDHTPQNSTAGRRRGQTTIRANRPRAGWPVVCADRKRCPSPPGRPPMPRVPRAVIAVVFEPTFRSPPGVQFDRALIPPSQTWPDCVADPHPCPWPQPPHRTEAVPPRPGQSCQPEGWPAVRANRRRHPNQPG